MRQRNPIASCQSFFLSHTAPLSLSCFVGRFFLTQRNSTSSQSETHCGAGVIMSEECQQRPSDLKIPDATVQKSTSYDSIPEAIDTAKCILKFDDYSYVIGKFARWNRERWCCVCNSN